MCRFCGRNQQLGHLDLGQKASFFNPGVDPLGRGVRYRIWIGDDVLTLRWRWQIGWRKEARRGRKRKRRGNPLFDLSFLSSPVMHTWHCAFVLALSEEQMSDDFPRLWATDPSLPLFDGNIFAA